MKKVKCLLAVAAFALSVTACSGSRQSTSDGTNGTNSQSGTSQSMSGSTTDSTQHR